jgi:undecaprenyl-phosphate 4-deoxy-4-formamido-L-arabinose transferase
MYLSVVIPVYNEEDNLLQLHARLLKTLAELGKSWEIIYTDDGSRDQSWRLLENFYEIDSDKVRLIRFNRNYGQHMAVFAGLEAAQGQVVVTLDADLQNPPEEIPALLVSIEEGHDVVGGWRQYRQDSILRKLPSLIINKIASRIVGVEHRDCGCMLRAYRREVVEAMNSCRESSSFIPALANLYADNFAEIPVKHDSRRAGKSKYGFLRLIKLMLDLITGFSTLPLKFTAVIGSLVAAAGLLFGIFLFVRRLIVGPEVEGVFTLFAILFVFTGLQIMALGLMGEYVGRIYREVRRRPRFIVRESRGCDPTGIKSRY